MRETFCDINNLNGVKNMYENNWESLNSRPVPEWFADNRQMRDFMPCSLGDIEQLLKMVRDLKLVRPHEDEEASPSPPEEGLTGIEWSDNEI